MSTVTERLQDEAPDPGVRPAPPEARRLRGRDFFVLWGDLSIGLLVAVTGAFLAARNPQSFNTFKDWFRLQHHTFAAAEGSVIHGAVAVVGKRPQVVDDYFYQSRFTGAPDNSVIERSAEKVWKDGNDVAAQHGAIS